MRGVVFDVETNGLLPELTTIHSLSIRDTKTNELLSCADQPGYRPIAEGLAVLAKAEVLYGHNALLFDIPAIQKVYPDWTFTGEVRDTLIASRMRWTDRKDQDFPLFRRGLLPGRLIGRHSLESWGYRLGALKGDFGETTDWSVWSPAMQAYNERDTEITRLLVFHLRQAGLSLPALRCEQELAEYLMWQETGGFPFDVEKAEALAADLAGQREIIAQRLRAQLGPFFIRDGKSFTPKRDNRARRYIAGAECQKIKLVDFQPGSRDHIALRLQQQYGWKPTAYGDDGKPTVDEVTLKGLPYPCVPDLVQYLTLTKRLGQISEGNKAWLKLPRVHPVTGLSHIHGRVHQSGTVTHRASHSDPNVPQTPKVGKPFGRECRSLYYVPPGWVEVGVDMSGIELRNLGHYMARYDGGAYVKLLLEGDVHTENQKVLGLPDEPAEGRTTKGRDATKTFFYAYLYGAGDLKLGTILQPTLSEAKRQAAGKKYRALFEGGFPALKYLVRDLEAAVKKNGCLTVLDGHRVPVRSEHSVLNSLLQSAGAILAKHWLVGYKRRMVRDFGLPGWTGLWTPLVWSHDEQQTACRPDIVGVVKMHGVQAIEDLTTQFNYRCPLTGEAKTGKDWAECH